MAQAILTNTKKDAPSVNASHDAAAIERCFSTRTGTVALSFFQNWTPMKAIRATPNTTSKAIMRPFDHGYFAPPHCRASSKQMT